MKVLITGCNGQLGNELKQRISFIHAQNVTFVDVADLDLTEQVAVETFFNSHHFTHLVNCAAFTNVDLAETNPSDCFAVNMLAVGNLANVAASHGIKVIHISTDYVFDGHGCRPYTETDIANPATVYGQSKFEGEKMLSSKCEDAVIIRTSWLYSSHGKNFVKTMLRLGNERSSLNVVCDQIGTPTYAGDLAEAIIRILNSAKWCPGVYHFSNEGACSWYDFAKAIFNASGLECDVTPINSDAYPSAVHRPFYSVLDKSKIKKIYGLKIPHWHDSLLKCLESIK